MEETQLQQVHLNDLHVSLGAKMVPFAGFNMPVLYTNLIEEHLCVRNSVGVFDVSHMGEFFLKGDRVLDFIQFVTSNDASKLVDGKVQYSCFPNAEGGIVDDLLVYCVEKNNVYMLVVNASNIEKDWNWISSYNNKGVEMHNISAKTALLAVQGPNATKIVQTMTKMDVLNLPYYSFVKGDLLGIDHVLISATGYTGSGGVEIYFEDVNDNANKVWDALFEAGAAFGLKPIGLGARDTLRLEMGFCLYGNDINDTTSPLEAGLGWITKFTKAFTNSENLAAQKATGVTKKLVGFEMIDRGIPRHDYVIKNAAGHAIGVVTSGTQAPSLGKAVGLGYVTTAHAAIDSDIYIDIRNTMVKAKVVKFPFK